MKIIKNNNNVTIIPSESNIHIGNADQFKQELSDVLEMGEGLIVTLDLSNVKNIDSTGLGKILVFNKRLQDKSGKLTIVNITSNYVKNLFSILRLQEIVDIK